MQATAHLPYLCPHTQCCQCLTICPCVLRTFPLCVQALGALEVEGVFDAGNTATLAWLRNKRLLPPLADWLPGLEKVTRGLTSETFWRMQLWVQLQLQHQEQAQPAAGTPDTAAGKRAVWGTVEVELRRAAEEFTRAPKVLHTASSARVLPHQLNWVMRQADC